MLALRGSSVSFKFGCSYGFSDDKMMTLYDVGLCPPSFYHTLYVCFLKTAVSYVHRMCMHPVVQWMHKALWFHCVTLRWLYHTHAHCQHWTTFTWSCNYVNLLQLNLTDVSAILTGPVKNVVVQSVDCSCTQMSRSYIFYWSVNVTVCGGILSYNCKRCDLFTCVLNWVLNLKFVNIMSIIALVTNMSY